jgi:hypothetical protein
LAFNGHDKLLSKDISRPSIAATQISPIEEWLHPFTFNVGAGGLLYFVHIERERAALSTILNLNPAID